MKGVFLTAQWRHLAMLHYEVEPSLLTPLLPRGTELDDRHGRHFVGLIAFLFLDTRVLGIPALFHQNFEEVNLRFYVQRKTRDEVRRGVVFIRELVPLPLIAEAARLTYNEPYRTVPIRHTLVETNGKLQSVEYILDGREPCRIALHGNGIAPLPLRAGSDEEFFSERGWGYTRQRDGGTVEYRVKHPRWNVWSPARWEVDGKFESFYDQPFADIISTKPSHAFIADGSPVSVHAAERIA
jgi:uncharacterized protein YqjF (DUF2071 family)